MSKYLTYAAWVATPVIIKLCFSEFTYSLLVCSIFLTIEILYFVINKYLGEIILTFSRSAALKNFICVIHDYNKFWMNFAIRVSCYVLGLVLSSLV